VRGIKAGKKFSTGSNCCISPVVETTGPAVLHRDPIGKQYSVERHILSLGRFGSKTEDLEGSAMKC
jgi:hypothetical protein